MQPLVITQTSITPFELPFKKPFEIGGNFLNQRVGFYLTLTSSQGASVQSEIAPLPGLSQETLKKAEHDLQEILPHLKSLEIPTDSKDLIHLLRKDPQITKLCASVKFGVESALMLLAAYANQQSLAEFLGARLEDVPSAGLLQGNYQQVMADAKAMNEEGIKVFKLKVGDRNTPLDVKKVNDLRALMGDEGLLRLDGNRTWTFNEAVLFTQLAGTQQIEFMEEPLGDPSRITEFYQTTHMPVALDETLSVIRCGVSAPGRCSPTLAQQEAVKAYVVKPTILGGVIPVLDWIEEARQGGKKVIISSCFESSVGLKILANLALLTGQTPGLGTARWLDQNIVNKQGVILKGSLQ